MDGRKYYSKVILVGLLILVALSSGCFEERLEDIVYADYVPRTLPPLSGGGPGLDIYVEFCAGCHALNGAGMLEGTPDFTDPGYWSSKGEEEIIAVIKAGKEGTTMPAWSDQLSDDEINDVLEYIKLFA